LRGVACVVVDCESGPVRLGLAGRLATALRAEYLRLDQLSTQVLRDVATRRAA
jgi:magnesium chelatase subunit D